MDLAPTTSIEPLGECAYVIRGWGEAYPWDVARALAGSEMVVEATSAYETVAIYVEQSVSPDAVRRILQNLELTEATAPRHHRVSVCYEMGEDLEEAANELGLSVSGLIEAHSGVNYRCYAVGFSPGFPFLGYLPPSIAGLGRRASPRARVPVGSVGITGRQTGIYPSESPGGWNLIGRTPLCLADLDDEYLPISAGDWVRFDAIGSKEFEARLGERL